jgi:hypothetical protein
MSGLDADGDALVTFRSPTSLRDKSPPEFSFGNWSTSDPLPAFEDDVTGFTLEAPPGSLVREPREIPELPVHMPDHPSFPPSSVFVPIPASASLVPGPSGVVSPSSSAISARSVSSHVSSSGDENIQETNAGASLPLGRGHDPSAHSGELRTPVRLGITLTFPDGERCDQRYSAHPRWTVPGFKARMASLLDTRLPIRLLLSPDWHELDHPGTVSLRVLPGSTSSCPYLEQNSVVRVHQCPPWTGLAPPREALADQDYISQWRTARPTIFS